ncbi:MAG: ATP-binding cassette domain-containing protein [Verrucomicrobiales bacterium]
MTESDAAPPPPLIAGSPAAAEADPAPSAAAAAAAAPQPPTDAERTAVLRTHGLTRRFGRFKAVDGLSLSVQEGEIYGFLGRNGAGKTTTIRMLMGIIKPGGGQIELLGKRSRRANAKVKRQIGYVSQSQYFYPWMNPVMLGKFCSGFYPTWDHQEYARLLRVSTCRQTGSSPTSPAACA